MLKLAVIPHWSVHAFRVIPGFVTSIWAYPQIWAYPYQCASDKPYFLFMSCKISVHSLSPEERCAVNREPHIQSPVPHLHQTENVDVVCPHRQHVWQEVTQKLVPALQISTTFHKLCGGDVCQRHKHTNAQHIRKTEPYKFELNYKNSRACKKKQHHF